MEVQAKVHRHRHRRTESRQRQRQHERHPSNTSEHTNDSTSPGRENGVPAPAPPQRHPRHRRASSALHAAEEGYLKTTTATQSLQQATSSAAGAVRLTETNERSNSADSLDDLGAGSSSVGSQQTVVLVNGHKPPTDIDADADYEITRAEQLEKLAYLADEPTTTATINIEDNDDANDMAGAVGGIAAVHTNLKLESNDLKLQPSSNAGAAALESPTQPGHNSSRNSSGDAMSLRETLQQLPSTITGMHGAATSSHRHRRTISPQSPTDRALEADSSFHRGILGLVDRELKQCSPTPSTSGTQVSSSAQSAAMQRKLQSLSDPQASPAQRSLRSRSSLDKSPRRKRSKSESRRRRERKLIAAGEMEVRQANETLMRYLKQCSEMNDASLSGELEIDQNYDERRVHRKTKSQRDKRGHLISKLYTAGGLSSILKELSDDIVPAEGEEIYNPFTPVVSPTDDTPAHIDKMFLQTSSGYRPVEHSYFKHSFMSAYHCNGNGVVGGTGGQAAGVRGISSGSIRIEGGAIGSGNGGIGSGNGSGGMRSCGSYGDTRCLLDVSEFSRHDLSSKIEVACFFQRIWLLLSNICHGLLAGLALAHLLFVLSSNPADWSKVLSFAASESFSKNAQGYEAVQQAASRTPLPMMNSGDSQGLEPTAATILDNLLGSLTGIGGKTPDEVVRPNVAISPLIEDYASFAEIYLNTFYCLTILCLVSVFDRMDICRLDLSNATELISFRWVIIAMIYIATIILTICSDSIDEKLYLLNTNTNLTLTQEEMLSNSILSVWSSLSITRSIGAICGWIMIGMVPHDDLLYEHLVDLAKYQLPNN